MAFQIQGTAKDYIIVATYLFLYKPTIDMFIFYCPI